MHLTRLIDGICSDPPAEARELVISSVTADSRAVRPGALFVCVRGERHDGHDHALDAVERGAVAIVAQRPLVAVGAPLLLADDSRVALAKLSARIHADPQERLRLVGITGTNGKTTVGWLVEGIARAAGIPCGVVGTVGIHLGEKTIEATHTTPDAEGIAAILAQAVEAGCQLVSMEVSSHALAQERVAALRFSAAGFTNLSRDHLDHHGSMEAYFEAKARLFLERLAPGATAVINVDDRWGRLLVERVGAAAELWGFSLSDPSAALSVEEATFGIEGIEAILRSPRGRISLRSPLVGQHNLQNLLCAAGLGLACGFPVEAVERGLSASGGAPGRLERLDVGGVTAFVDYAHTDDALARVCAALREASAGRLIVVFGCGGDRDRGKRPLMGEAAGRGAALAIVTSDNPRGEEPAAIVEEILPGLVRAGRAQLTAEEAIAGAEGFTVEVDRRAAIELAVAAARVGDVILVAGKGHERFQLIGDIEHPFDDREELRRSLGV